MEIDENTDFPSYYPLDARLFYVTAGEGLIEVGGEPLRMPMGSVLYINAGEVYRLLPCRATYLAVNFDFSWDHAAQTTPIPPVKASAADAFCLIERHTFADAPCFDTYGLFPDFYTLQVKLTTLEKEYVSKRPFSAQESSYLLASVLTALARRAEQRSFKDGGLDVEGVIRYIHQHLADPLDNHVLGRAFHFHPNYISAECKRYTGKPLHQYVIQARILGAVALMEAGNNDITDVARQTGFCDTNHFARHFRRVMGISPGKYARACVEKRK